jgi:dihydrofolate synthase / folylpolyglutamate synthase
MLATPVNASRLTTYRAARDWLFAQTRGGAPRSVGRMQALMAELELASPKNVLHVVGTNGKGSVSAMLAAALTAAGKRTGRFLSPHVEEFRERVAVDGRWVGEAEVLGFVRSLPQPLEARPAFFELTLALALRHFAHEGAEWAVVEAGVGARHDATRALTNVRGVVITNVGHDHLDTLGPTLREVAYDKADAIRPGVPTLTAAEGEALTIITEVAAQRRSPLFFSTPQSPLFAPPEGPTEAPPTRARNQRLAAAALRLQGVPEAAIREGLRASLPARAERFKVAGREILLDGAHNPAAAGALLEHTRPPFVLLFGTLPKKPGAQTLAVLAPHAREIILTDAAPGEASTLEQGGLTVVRDPQRALSAALARLEVGEQLVVAGSFYLASRLRPSLVQAAD